VSTSSEGIGTDIPLLLACSGGSRAAELTELVARKLANGGLVYMSCPAAVSARIDTFMQKLASDEKVVVLDGCGTDCVAATLRNSGFDGFMHIRLSDIGIAKEDARPDPDMVQDFYEHVKARLQDPDSWKVHRFSYDASRDRFVAPPTSADSSES
jgi:uncharacterized metal-binding protein